MEDFRGRVVLGAVDLAETTDLVSAKILIIEGKMKYIHSHYFIPEIKLTESDDKAGGAQYDEWKKQGCLTVCEGNDVDLGIVADWFYQLYIDYDIRLYKCGYDQKFARDWMTRMESYGWTRSGEELVVILQNKATLSNAMKLAEADFRHRLINYNDHPIDKWCLGNCGIEVDNVGQCMAVKLETQKRIDGGVCLIILYEMYRRYRTDINAIAERG